MDLKLLFMFLGISLLSFWKFKNVTQEMIKEIGINKRFFPKHYVHPNRVIKRFFKIKQRKIPKYLYIEAYITIIFSCLWVPNVIITYISSFNKTVMGMLVMLHILLIIVNCIYLMFFSSVFNKRVKQSGDGNNQETDV